jgi:hypothetical protein
MRERKRTERNTERRRQGDRMDEREMEEEGKNREREEWGRLIKILFFGMVILYLCEIVNRSQKAGRANKAYYLLINHTS